MIIYIYDYIYIYDCITTQCITSFLHLLLGSEHSRCGQKCIVYTQHSQSMSHPLHTHYVQTARFQVALVEL